MAELTEDQKKLLILIGKPDDGSQQHVVADGDRILQELVSLGLVCYTGKTPDGTDSYDLTDKGEEVYDRLSGRREGR